MAQVEVGFSNFKGMNVTSPELNGHQPMKRKRNQSSDEAELEIDVSLPEPLSKKALRKAKKQRTMQDGEPKQETKGTIAEFEAVGRSEGGGPRVETPSNVKGETISATSRTRSQYGIWIGNLPFAATADMLREFLINNGRPTAIINDHSITRINIPAPSEGPAKKTAIKPMNKGFAYVDFGNEDAMKSAMALSETSFGGRRVLIKDARNFDGRPEKSKGGLPTVNGNPSFQQKPPNRRIFVGNLSFDVTKEDLQKHFAQCGIVEDVHMATFEDSGKCKGFAWVTFTELDAGEAAVRGFVLRDSPDLEQESHHEKESIAKKKPKKQRWFVNKLFGRELRCEFAEDSTLRYKKRFGKKLHDDDQVAEDFTVDDDFEPQSRPVPRRKSGTSLANIKPGPPTDLGKGKGRGASAEINYKAGEKPSHLAYRTGGITAGTGTKVVF